MIDQRAVRVAWALLTPREPRRATAWALLHDVAGHPLGLSSRCGHCGSHDHGQVHVTGDSLRVSVSYTPRYAVVAVAPPAEVACVGIDAEPTHDVARDREGLAGVLAHSDATLRDWVRTEAAVKADGRGLRVDPARVVVHPVAASLTQWSARVPGALPLTGWDVPGPPDTLVSVAARGA